MKYQEIEAHILQGYNAYEQERGISTEFVSLVAGKESMNWSIYSANKSDGTRTLFFAYKNKNSQPYAWRIMCPSKEHIEAFSLFIRGYWNNEEFNHGARL